MEKVEKKDSGLLVDATYEFYNGYQYEEGQLDQLGHTENWQIHTYSQSNSNVVATNTSEPGYRKFILRDAGYNTFYMELDMDAKFEYLQGFYLISILLVAKKSKNIQNASKNKAFANGSGIQYLQWRW